MTLAACPLVWLTIKSMSWSYLLFLKYLPFGFYLSLLLRLLVELFPDFYL